ncbi:hypothetical protein HMPREF1427_00006 [Helicobacter pylori GAM83Bi]|nr:hypothetical protein HMPREF1427_00006 [Helicobacter pylori GAM83Bi]EMH41038.1 hypothetical protein HMPREF1428_00115 [Helicobacter pylori GAM83T]
MCGLLKKIFAFVFFSVFSVWFCVSCEISYNTKKALLKQAEALKAQGCDLVACIEQSIRRNYNEIYEVMHFEKLSYKSEAEKRNEEVMEQFNFKGSNPKFGGYCIW